MADWITVTARDSGGNVVAPDANDTYGEDAVQIDFTFSQNTTANTRAATLTFSNAIAEEKNAYNPDSPDGMQEFVLFQFGKRSGNITGVANNMCYVNEATCSDFASKSLFSNLDVPAGDLQPYTGSVTPPQLDYTLYNPSGPGVWQTNGENRQRNYVSMATGADPVPYTITLTISSTAPWYLTSTDGGEFLGFPSNVFRAAGSTDWAMERTYNDLDVDTPVTVVINVAGNSGGTSRTGNIIFVNRQGVTNTINLNQKQYVVNNQPPNPVITGGPGVTCGTSGSSFWNGSSSNDPDGTIVAHRWDPPGGGTGTEQSGHPGNSPVFSWTASQNTQCFSNATVGSGPRLYVRDDRNAANTSGYVGIIGAGRATCQDTCSVVTSGPSMVAHGSTATVTASVNFNDNSGCGAPTPTLNQSSVTLTSPTCPGDTRTASFSASSPYTGCSGSQVVQFGTRADAPSFTISGQSVSNSNASQAFSANCGASSSAGISSQSISCSGAGVNINSPSGSASFTVNTAVGSTSTVNCTCNATDNASPASCRQSNSTTVSFSHTRVAIPVTYNCSGAPSYTCSDPGDGSGTYSSLSACQNDCMAGGEINSGPVSSSLVAGKRQGSPNAVCWDNINLGANFSGTAQVSCQVSAGGATHFNETRSVSFNGSSGSFGAVCASGANSPQNNLIGNFGCQCVSGDCDGSNFPGVPFNLGPGTFTFSGVCPC